MKWWRKFLTLFGIGLSIKPPMNRAERRLRQSVMRRKYRSKP